MSGTKNGLRSDGGPIADSYLMKRRVFAISGLLGFIPPFTAVLLFPFAIPSREILSLFAGLLSSLFVWTLLPFRRLSWIGQRRQWLHEPVCAAGFVVLSVVVGLVGETTGLLGDPAWLLPSVALLIPTTLFVSGYAALTLTGASHGMSRVEVWVCSIVVSVLVTGLSGFLAWGLGDLRLFSFLSLAIINAFVLVASALVGKTRQSSTVKDRETEISTSLDNTDLTLFLVIVFLSFVLVFTYCITHFSQESPLPLLGDEFDQVGNAMRFLNGYISWQESALGVSSDSYPYLFHLLLAEIIAMTGTPAPMTLVLAGSFLLPLPTVAFYSLSKELTRNTRVSLLSTIAFQSVSGFGWLTAVMNAAPGADPSTINRASELTYDIIFSTWFPTIVAPYLIDLAIFMIALSFTLKHNISSRSLILLLTPLLFTGMVSHLEKGVLLGFLGAIVSLLQVPLQNRPFRTKELGVALILSVCLVALFDLTAPIRMFTVTLVMPLIAVSCGAGIMIITGAFQLQPKPVLTRWKRAVTMHFGVCMLIGGLLVAAIAVADVLTMSQALVYGVTIPLYALVPKMGILGPFAFVGWFSLRHNDGVQRYCALVLLSIAALLAELILYHAPFSLYPLVGNFTEEFRYFRDITWSVIVIAGAIGAVVVAAKFASQGQKNSQKSLSRILLCSLLIGAVVAPSFLSHLLKIEYSVATSGINDQTAGVAGFMGSVSIPRGSSIYAPASVEQIIHSVTGALVYTSDSYAYGAALSESNDPSTVLFLLAYLNVSYAIVPNNDQHSMLNTLLDYFPLVYVDSYHSVYEVSQISYPHATSSVELIDFDLDPDKVYENGLSASFAWVEQFQNSSGWLYDPLTTSNVSSHQAETTQNGTLILEATGETGQQMVLFYMRVLEEPVSINADTRFWLRFRTQPHTRLLAHVIYNDSTYSNALYSESPYMQSDSFVWSNTPVQRENCTITALRIGITNHMEESCSEILAEIDTAVISRADQGFSDTAAALAVTEIDYTVDYWFSAASTSTQGFLVTWENQEESRLEQLLNVSAAGRSILVFGDLSSSSWMKSHAGVVPGNQSVLVDSVRIGSETYPIPSMNVTEIAGETGTTIATYSGVPELPLATLVDMGGNTSLVYLNSLPLLDCIRVSDSKEHYLQIRNVLVELLREIGLPAAGQTERNFYLKSMGLIRLEGNVTISCEALVATQITPMPDGPPCPIEICGQIEITAFGYGYIALAADTQVTLRTNQTTRVLNQLRLLAKVPHLRGYGTISFDALTASFPYRPSFLESPYVALGLFELGLMPVSGKAVFVQPYLLGGISR